MHKAHKPHITRTCEKPKLSLYRIAGAVIHIRQQILNRHTSYHVLTLITAINTRAHIYHSLSISPQSLHVEFAVPRLLSRLPPIVTGKITITCNDGGRPSPFPLPLPPHSPPSAPHFAARATALLANIGLLLLTKRPSAHELDRIQLVGGGPRRE